MKSLCSTITLVALAALAVGPEALAQRAAPPSTAELLRILRITTFRVRVPRQDGYTWDMVMLGRDQLKPKGTNPPGLTKYTWLLAMRETAGDTYEFTLPDRGGSYSQGEFDICKEVSCKGQTSVHWLDVPTYSKDGAQCVLGEFSNLDDQVPSAFITLVRVPNTPDQILKDSQKVLQ